MRVLAWPGLDAGNPYCPLLYREMQKQGTEVHDFTWHRAILGRYDIWHLHWPDYYLNQPALKAFAGVHIVLLSVLWARIRNAKIFWTVHNLNSHNGCHSTLEKYFWRQFTSLLHGFISLSDGGMEMARDRFPRLRTLPGFVVPHGHYRDAYPNHVSRDCARAELDIPADARAVLFFGGVSRYKNVLHLIRIFRQAAQPDWRLCIAGHVSSDVTLETLKAAVGNDPRVLLHLEWIAAQRVQMFLRAADLVVLPFREIFNSGSALLSLSFNRPLLVPAQGALPELRATVGPEWMRTYEGELTAGELTEAMNWATASSRSATAPLAPLEWPRLAENTRAAYRSVLARNGGRSN